MKRSIRVLLALAAALAGVLAIGMSNAYANDLCGTTITEDTKLDHDHDCSGSTGITIATPGVTLDLCDYTINGDETAGLHGIIITADDVTVKNGTVSDFIDGISVRDADRVKLKNLWVISNDDDGVNAEESQWLQLYKVRANDNGEEGAELDGVSDGLVTKSKANRNGLEGFETDATATGAGAFASGSPTTWPTTTAMTGSESTTTAAASSATTRPTATTPTAATASNSPTPPT